MNSKETIFIATFNVNNVLTVIFNSIVINLIIITNISTIICAIIVIIIIITKIFFLQLSS